ncbi:MAG: hypothetical protein GY906_03625, partial [bacterium]|nr:hypothetical protein [bacterium]
MYSLLAVAALQIVMVYGTLSLPLLDTRLHYNYDNAWMTFFARNGNRAAELRSQFGVTNSRYESWEAERGKPSYYTDHPFLMKALFQQYCKVVGHGEFSGRSFALLISFGVAAGVLILLLRTTGSLLAGLVGSCLLVSLPLFALFQSCLKFELDGMLAGVWTLVAATTILDDQNKPRLWLFGTACMLAVLAHWTSGLCAALIVMWFGVLAVHRKSLFALRPFLFGAAGGVVGALLLAGMMVFLHSGVDGAEHALTSSFERRSDDAAISNQDYWQRQGVYARTNFTLPFAVATIGAGLWWSFLGLKGRRRSADVSPATESMLKPGFWMALVVTLTTACIWQFVFRQGSHVHIYWQLWFTLPVVLLWSGLTARMTRHRSVGRQWQIAVLVVVVLLTGAARQSRSETLDSQLGTKGDIRFLKSLRDDRFSRFVFLPTTDNELNSWFTGPLFEFYTDRKVVVASAGERLEPDEKVL